MCHTSAAAVSRREHFMDVCKLRLKLGENELEVEGLQHYVEKQRDRFLATLGSRNEHASPARAAVASTLNPNQLDLGNGNTIITPNSNLHAAWKI
jgi:hypothetical protein